MAISAQHIVAYTRHSVSTHSQLCWTVLRGGLSRLLPALFALWTRLPELLHILTNKVRILEIQSLYIGSEKSGHNVHHSTEEECLVTCEVLYTPQGEREMDIIFIHGLHGSTLKTWRQGDWNTKYREVQRILLRQNNSSTTLNQGVCPHCHFMKSQTRKSFCNLSDVKRAHPSVPSRSYSLPNGVYRSTVDNRMNNDSVYIEENEEDCEDDVDILSFIVSEHKDDTDMNNHQIVSDLSDEIHNIPFDFNLEGDSISEETTCQIFSNSLDSECKRNINNCEKPPCDISAKDGRIEDYQSFAMETCDINFINDCIAGSLHNLRAVCDNCSNKCNNDLVMIDCPKCNEIQKLLFENINPSHHSILPVSIERSSSDEDVNKTAVKRKLERVDLGTDDLSKSIYNRYENVKFRKIDVTDEISEHGSSEEYFDIENEICDFIGFNNDFIHFSNGNLNDLSQRLYDDERQDWKQDNGENNSEESDNFLRNDDVFYNEGNIGKHFCTCDKNTTSNTIKIEPKDNRKNESLSECWPKDWLPLDYPNARIISISYTTDQHLWRPMWIRPYGRTSLKHRSNEMVQKLAALGVGNKPVVWVGHSKGGLFIKEIFSTGYESSTNEENAMEFENIYNSTKGLVFYSVPHRGSPLANITFPPLLRVSSELEEIQHESDFVLQLHERFLRALEEGIVDPTILSYTETRRTLMGAFYLRIVSTQSADPGVGNMYYGVSLDHREICKPTSRSCFLYKELLSVIEHIQKSVTNEDFEEETVF